MNITFTGLDFTGAPDMEDMLGARYAVRVQNDLNTAENARRTAVAEAQDPPVAPVLLPIFPTATGAQLKASYLAILLQDVNNLHASRVRQGSADSARFSDAQLTQIKANLNARLDAGENPDDIVTDTAA